MDGFILSGFVAGRVCLCRLEDMSGGRFVLGSLSGIGFVVPNCEHSYINSAQYRIFTVASDMFNYTGPDSAIWNCC